MIYDEESMEHKYELECALGDALDEARRLSRILEQLTAEGVRLKESNAFLKNQAKQLNAECARRRNENKGLQVKLEEVMKTSMDQLARLVQLRAENDDLHSRMPIPVPTWATREAELEQENARLEAENMELYRAAKGMTAIREDVGTLRTQLANAHAKIRELESITNDARGLRDANSVLRGQIDSQKYDLAGIRDALEASERKRNQAREDLEKVRDYL